MNSEDGGLVPCLLDCGVFEKYFDSPGRREMAKWKVLGPRTIIFLVGYVVELSTNSYLALCKWFLSCQFFWSSSGKMPCEHFMGDRWPMWWGGLCLCGTLPLLLRGDFNVCCGLCFRLRFYSGKLQNLTSWWLLKQRRGTMEMVRGRAKLWNVCHPRHPLVISTDGSQFPYLWFCLNL